MGSLKQLATELTRRWIAWAAPPHDPAAPGKLARQRATFACGLYAASLLLFALFCCLLHLLFAVIFQL
ncbi:hypothetical protein [Burkholderia cepacia]|uniref:Uncharacterized protein n=1 Tax=Burkholderia cepacia GG4 TaxID=1009846 RepID=A0A9W3PC76_BURCE|nr:hypothetical protein [Burkholderia cepacia]AFQ51346.1 hypothetical protein GEM_4959 [Burkholderia cepacia GG4]